MLVNPYAPNFDTPSFFNDVFKLINQWDNDQKIIAGDFNLVFNLDQDKRGGRYATHDEAVQVIHEFTETQDMIR